MIRILTIAAVIGFTAPAFAADEIPWFEVELIVFKYSRATTAAGEERWPMDPGNPPLRDAVAPIPVSTEDADDDRPAADSPGKSASLATSQADLPGIPPPINDTAPPRLPETLQLKIYPESFQLLSEETLRLTAAYRRLVRSQAYEPLLHFGWLQPAVAGNDAQPVHVYTGMVERPGAEEAGAVSAAEISRPAEMLTGPTEALLELPEEFRTLDGTVRLSLTRYLHLAVDLVYRPEGILQVEPINSISDLLIPTGGEAPIKVAPAIFRLTESRRMRSQEIHYFDHPAFGMIALVTPYEIPVLELPIPQPTVSSGGDSEPPSDHEPPAAPPVLQ